MKKRLVNAMLVGALALVAALFTVCIPASADAADVAEVTAGGTTKKYDNFAEAWTAAETAEVATVKLLANVDKGNHTQWPITVARGMEITLDLNGFDIDRGLAAEVPDGNVITVSGILTLNDSNGGNGAITGGHNDTNGGGVRVVDGGAFTMNSGTISDNEAGNTGGGVYMAGSTFIMNGGTISNNTATSLNGGGVYMYAGTFEMSGGTIYGNTADNDGGGVAVYDGTFTMSDGTISGNTAGNSGGGVYVVDGTFEMSDGTISGNTAGSSGGGVYVFYIMYNSEFDISGGTISGNISNYGGGVYVDSGGVFTMDGGEISENKSDNGGGVYVYEGEFTMQGGKIHKNTKNNSVATSNGGGVYIANGTFTMHGGSISENTADNGGGVVVAESEAQNASFTMDGGEISGNTADQPGGGVYCVTSGAVLNMSGTPVITGNTVNNVANNLYLLDGMTVSIGTGGLSAGANIGVTTQTPPTSNAAVPVTGANSADYRRYFTSDGGFAVVNTVTSSGQIVQLAVSPLSITYEDEGGVPYTGKNLSDLPDEHNVGTATTLVDGKRDGYTFGGWFTTSDCQTGTDVATLGAYDYATNITLYAKWMENTHTITATAGANGTITPSGDVDVTEGENQTFTIEANAGYQIADVTVDGNSEGALATYTFTNVTAAHTIAASFEEIPATQYTITLSADPAAGGTVTGGGTFDENTSCTVEAAASSGYHFVKWTEGGTQVSTSASYTFSLTANRTLVAVFEQIPTPPINITPAAIITQGGAPANLTINIGGAGSPPNDPAHFGSLEISANGSGFTTVSSGNYTLSFSSIHIALNQSWLNTLAPGAYTLRVNLAGAYAGISLTTQLTVTTPPPAPPKTGDNNQPLIWLSLCGLGIAGIGILVRSRRGRA